MLELLIVRLFCYFFFFLVSRLFCYFISSFSQIAFRALVGSGYQTLQSLLLDLCQWQPSEALLNALLDMLVDGRFDVKSNFIVKVTQ